MDSEHSDSARTASDQPTDSGARFIDVLDSEFTLLGRHKLDWLAAGAATPPAPSSRRHPAEGHGQPHP